MNKGDSSLKDSIIEYTLKNKYMKHVSPQKDLKTAFSVLLFVAMLFSNIALKAQTITIGIATTNSNLYGPVYSVGNTGSRAQRVASIYPGTLLTGLNNGDNITSFEFNRFTAALTFTPGTNLKIYVKNYSSVDWGAGSLDFSTAIAGATLVYDGDPATIIGNSVGWKQFVFNAPYVYNTANGSNLAVIYDYYQPASTGTATSINWYTDNATQYPAYTTNSTKYTTNSSSPAVSPTAMATSVANHAQIKINYTAAPPCVSPPTAGNIQIQKQWYCGGQSFSMNLVGNSNGVGQAFQWQESTDNVNWTSIVSATNTSYTTSLNVPTKYFRVIATCSGNSDTTDAQSVFAYTTALSGNYTINKNIPKSFTNFTSVNDAVSVLNCMGVSGPVNIRLSSDVYNEQVLLTQITGANATNTVRFIGNNSTIKFLGTVSADRYVFRLNNADYIHLDSLTIEAEEAGSYGYVIHLLDGSSNNKITNCIIKATLTNTTTAFAGVAFSGSTTSATTAGLGYNNNIIENNTIIGGYYSIIIYGTSTNSAGTKGNIIRNNILRDAYQYTVYTFGCDSTHIVGNDMYRLDRTNGIAFYGVYASTNSFRTIIEKNKIHNPFGSGTGTTAVYGIYVNATDSKQDQFIVRNNLVYNINGTTGGRYGLYNQGSDSTSFYNNTVIMDDPNPSTGVINGFIHGSTAATGVKLLNNIFYINSPGTGNRIGEYWSENTSTFLSNNNGFYVSNAGSGVNAIAFQNNINYLTLTDWQTFGKDVNSVHSDPLFVSGPSGNHIPSASTYNNSGLSLVQVSEDYTGAARSVTPDIGAYEFSPSTEDVSVNSIELKNICVGVQPVFVKFTNAGLSPLNSVQINWTLNGVLQLPYSFPGLLPSGEDTVISIGLFNVVKDVPYSIVTWSSNPNGVVDLNKANDTAKSKIFRSGLEGAYTIGGPAADYQSLAFVAQELSDRGACGPVTFNMDPTAGPYVGLVAFKNVPGTSFINTVTINGNGSVVKAAPTLTDKRSVILIEGSDYFTLDSINVVADSSTYGWGIHLFSGSDYNTIRKSTVTVSNAASTTNFSGIVISGSLTSATTDGLGSNNLIENNIVKGGYYGIAINGITNNIGSIYNRVINNIIQDYYAYGVYINSSDSALVSRNDISRPVRINSTTTAGIYVSGNSMSVIVERNRVHDVFASMQSSTSSSYGIYQTANDAVATRPLIVRNNAIYNMQSNGTLYGIYNTSSNNALYYNNTVHIEDLNSTTSNAGYAFYQTTEASGIELKNNIFYINRAGTGARAAVRFNTTTSTIASNYNNLYATNIGTGTNALGFYGTTDHKTLTAWQGTNNDLNSYDVSPLLVSASTGDVTPNSISLDGTGVPSTFVTDDLNGNLRSSPPDIGALEFNITLDDAGITSIDSPETFCPGLQVVKATIKNFGVSNISTVKVNWQINGVNQTVYNFAGTLASGEDTSVVLGTINAQANVNYSIKAWTSLPNNIVDNVNTNDTTIKQNIRTALFGINTIGGPSANFQSLTEAVQAMNLYGVCDTVIFDVDSAAGPYNEQVLISNFSGTSIDKQVIFKGNGAIIQFEPTVSASRYVFRIENTDYITIDGFNIKSINGTYGWGVHLITGSDYNTISNNKIQLSQTSTTSANFVGIACSGSTTSASSAGVYSHNKIIGNTIDGGYYGISVYGTSGTSIPLTQGNIINNNKVLNSYSQGIYTIYQQNIEISGNEVSRPTRASTGTFYGIEASSVTAGLKMYNNRIHNLFGGVQSSTSTSFSIYMASSDHVGSKGIVANNLIYNINGGGIVYGIYNSGSDSIKYLFNSISLEDKIAGKTQVAYGFYQTTEAKGLEYYNNSVLVDRLTTGNQVAMYFSTNTTIPVSNHNNFYTPNGYVAYHTSLRENLSDWQAVNTNTPYDLNSTYANPLYNGITNLIPQASSPLVNSGIPMVEVLKDIEGTNRNITNPFKGAYEKSGDFRGPYYIVNPISNTISTNNLTVNGVVSISDVSGVDVAPTNRPRIYYKLSTHNNKYEDNTSATNGWKYTTALNGSSPFNFVIDYSKLFGGVVNVNNEIEYFFVAQDSLGFVSTSHGAFKKSPVSITTIDSNQFGLIGNTLKYRIASLITEDTLYVGNAHTLKNLTANDGLFKYLNDNIITSNLTVIVTSNLSEDGTNALNDLSEAGVGNYSIRIIPQTKTVYNIQGSYTGGLIRLNGADRISIDGSVNDSGYYFNITNTSTSSNIAAIQLIGLGTDTTGASYNTIKGSVISTGASTGNSIGIHIGGLSIPYDAVRGNKNNKIINNKIFKGSVGIYNSGVSAGLSDSLLIIGNIIGANDGATATDNIRLYGIALEYGSNTIVENNLIQNIRNASSQQSWGIAVYGNFNNGVITKNKIQNIVGGSGSFGGRGLEINSGTQKSNIRITNNFISGISGAGSANLSSTANVGLYINGTSDLKVYNNSIHLSGSIAKTTAKPDTSAAIYIRGNSSQLDVLNNTISNTMKNTTDTSLAYAFVSTVNDTAFTNFDYNNFYVGDFIQNPQGILSSVRGVGFNNIADIRLATSKNTNSINISPNFVSDINLHAQGSALYQKGQVVLGLVDDIDGDLRGNPPCIGADEFTAPNNDIVNIGFSYPSSVLPICGISSDSIQVIIFNQGLQAQTGFEVKAYISGVINDTVSTIYNGNLLPSHRDTVTLGYYNSSLATGNISIRSILNLTTDVGRENDTTDMSSKILMMPVIPNILPFTAACVGNSTTVIASAGEGDTKWYTQANGGVPVKVGDTLRTPNLNSSSTYYAETSTSTIQTVSTGLTTKYSSATSGAGTTNFGIVFDVLAPFTLESVVVYPVASTAGLSGTVTIDVIDGSNAVVHSRVVNVVGNPASSVTPQRVMLNFDLLPGTNYKLRPGTRGAGITGLMFEPSASAPGGNYGYPYVVPGLLSIKTSTLTAGPTNTARNDLYYYFYDWNVKTGQEGCVSARVPVVVTPAPLPGGSTVSQSAPFQGVFNAGTLATPDAACAGDTLTYMITPPTGYNLSDLGVTWTVLNPVVKTLSGQTPAGTVTINGLSLRYVAALGDEDSTLKFTASIKSLLSSGCDSQVTRHIKIEKTPVVDLGPDKTICVGSSVVLDAGNAGASYLWSTGETTQSISVSTSGTYSVKVTNAGTCFVEDTINVNAIALPIVNLGPDQTVCAGTVVTLDAGNPGSTYLWSTGSTAQTIQPTVTGIYTVTVTANGGCSTKDTISVTFNALPVVNLGADLNICLSDTVTLDAGNPGSTYLWSTGATTRTIRVNAAATYSVSVTNANGCVNTDEVVVTNKATPNAGFTIAAAAGSSITFQASGTVGLTYAWNFGDPGSPNNTSQLQAPVHVFSGPGSYDVTLTVVAVATGCKSTSTQTITITSVGNDLVEFFKLGAAPNPFVAETKINYTLPEDANSVSVEVYDMIGRKVADIVNNEYQASGNYQFNYRNEDMQTSAGIYMVKLTVDGRTAYIRIIDANKR